MTNKKWRNTWRILLVSTFIAGSILAFGFVPQFISAQSDTPAAECGSGPNVVCPTTNDLAHPYIASVTAVPDGIIILLTQNGLDKARECGGAADIAHLTAALYATIPANQKVSYQLDWNDPALEDEIYAHAFAENLSGELGGLGSIYERANPINIAFADYGGPGEMTSQATGEQALFAALGTVHRSVCG